jgi:hypothetical protein
VAPVLLHFRWPGQCGPGTLTIAVVRDVLALDPEANTCPLAATCMHGYGGRPAKRVLTVH